MKRKEFLIINGLIAACVLYFGIMTVSLSANQNVLALVGSWFGGRESSNQTAETQKKGKSGCTDKKPLDLASYSTDPHISKLAQYQKVCSSYVTNELMFFTGFVGNETEAEEASRRDAAKLQLFAAAGLRPIVIAEPYAADGPIQFRDFMNGRYDSALDSYFTGLKQAGVTDEMLGTWVPFPEPNTPQWKNKDTQPSDFVNCMNRYFRIMREHYPNVHGSVLLNAETFQPDDLEWNNGDYLDLTQYLQGLDRDAVKSLGIQGFPWVSRANTPRREIFRASEFLQPDLAIAAARELRTRDIWLNTGTFASKYASNPRERVEITPDERSAVLTGILETAGYIRSYQQNQYRVRVHLFAEDKSRATEATDWSFGQDDKNRTVFMDFVQKAGEQQVPLALFDQQR